ncbi:reverse transcriptase domain-containing protein [Tanacetum coccineum]
MDDETIEMLQNCHGHNLSKGNIIKIFYHGLSEITQEVLNAAAGGSSNSDTDKIMARMDVMTLKMDAQYKELQSNAKKTKPGLNEDDIPIIDVIDEILEEDFDALLDEGSKILHTIEGTLLEEEIFAEFNEVIAMTADENSDSESDTEEPPFEKITINTDYKIKTSLEEPPMDLELKPLLDNIEYVFLEEPFLLPHKQAFAWKTTDIPGIYPSFCKHKIQLLDDKKPVVQKQRRLNPNMQEVVKKEIVKLLDTGIIYPIADSPWVSPIHCVPKKGGITVVTNKNDELIPTRNVTGWRVCIDYRKLNEATAKDHFPLPFMDQMLERLAGNKYFYLLDGFFGYFQIPIDPNDQEKTTFTCPFGTYAYRRMPFGLCNAPATFQRCMLAIFHDMIEEPVKVFMDDFFVFGNSFDTCLSHLDNAPIAGIEVDKAKIDVILKLPPPTNIKGIRSFLGHASFYQRFIEDFLKIARPITKLLEKDTPFEFDDECQKALDLFKEKLTCAPVIISPNWNIPFELMCDASNFAAGAKSKTKKGTENVVADHLSLIENDETSDDSEVDDNFPGETLMEINIKMDLGSQTSLLEGNTKLSWRLEPVEAHVEQGQQVTTQRDEMIMGLSQQVQTLQAAVQQRDIQIQQLQTLVAEMSSRESTLMQCILGLDRLLTDVERRSPGPQ